MLVKALEKMNIHVLVVLATIASVVISGGVTALVLLLVYGELDLTGMLLSTLVPLVLAPPQLYFLLINRKRLKEIEEKLKKANELLQKEIKIVTSKEKELETLNARIEKKIRARTRELEELLKEKEILLNEVHHRVKNNLQIILSMIRLQKRQLVDKQDRDKFEDLQHRILAMALVYEQLYKMSEFETINLKFFLPKLAQDILASSLGTHKIVLHTEVDEVSLNIDKAIPLSLLVTEILSNSIKHAFPDVQKGRFELVLKKKREDRAVLRLADNGVGFVNKGDGTLGFKIIASLVQQLNAEMRLKSANGVKYTIELAI